MTARCVSGIVELVETLTCPSCGYSSAARPAEVEPPFPASSACYAAYLELSAYNFERARWDFLHQEAVDAYAAQHPGPSARPISVWFALVGLHLAVDKGRSGRQVQLAHMRLGRHKRAWPMLQPPAGLTCMTAGDVMHQAPGDDRDRAILRWAEEVWLCWVPIHDMIATLCTEEDL